MNRGENARERILEGALELLTEYGYEGMSLQQLADRVGLHKSSLFHYFDGKEALADEVCALICEHLLKAVEPVLATDPVDLEQILLVGDAMVDHFGRERWTARFLLRLMVARQDADFGVSRADADHAVIRLLVVIGTWLDRARNDGVIRPIRVRQTLLNVMGVVLFHPAVVHDIGRTILDEDPWSPEGLAARKRELRSFLRGALSPLS